MTFSSFIQQSRGGSLHPFLQQDTGCSRGKPEADVKTEVLFTQVNTQYTHSTCLITLYTLQYTPQKHLESIYTCQLCYGFVLLTRCSAASHVMWLARILSCRCRLQQVLLRFHLGSAAWRRSCRRPSRKHRSEKEHEHWTGITWSSVSQWLFCLVIDGPSAVNRWHSRWAS